MNNKITFPRLAALLADKSGRSKRFSEDFLRELFSLVSEQLEAGNSVKIKGLGTFRLLKVEPRKSVDVTTGQPMEISGHTKVTFTPAKEMAEAINAPFEAFSAVEIGDDIDIKNLVDEENLLSQDESETIELQAAEKNTFEAEVDSFVTESTIEVATEIVQTEKSLADQDVIDTESESTEPQPEDDSVLDSAEPQPEDDSVLDSAEPQPEIDTNLEIAESQPNIDLQITTAKEQNESPQPAKIPRYSDRRSPVFIHATFEDEDDDDIVIIGDSTVPKSEVVNDYREPINLDNQFNVATKKKKWEKVLFIVAAIVVLAMVGTFIFSSIVSPPATEVKETESKAKEVSEYDYEEVSMTVGSEEVPERVQTGSKVETKNEAEAPASAEDPVPTAPSDALVYDTISTTRFLTTMAKIHYGNNKLWPYIYEANKSKLGHPDKIRPGTPVVIPNLGKIGVNAKNPRDIEKAQELGREIYARYGKSI